MVIGCVSLGIGGEGGKRARLEPTEEVRPVNPTPVVVCASCGTAGHAASECPERFDIDTLGERLDELIERLESEPEVAAAAHS
jgi:hypothetical protein